MLKKSKKLLIGISCLLFLALAFPALAKEQSGKPETTPPDLEKITFIHYAKGSANSEKPEWDESWPRYKLLFGGIKWSTAMTYEVNPDESGLDDAAVTHALSESLETWDDAITSDFELFNELIPLTDELTPGDYDERNIVVWRDLAEIYGTNVIAVNSFWFNPALKIIVDSDVVFNTDYDWSVRGEEGMMDLQNIATHEFGHNGLSDLYMPPSMALTMFGYSDFGEIDKQTLGVGDKLGIQALYSN